MSSVLGGWWRIRCLRSRDPPDIPRLDRMPAIPRRMPATECSRALFPGEVRSPTIGVDERPSLDRVSGKRASLEPDPGKVDDLLMRQVLFYIPLKADWLPANLPLYLFLLVRRSDAGPGLWLVSQRTQRPMAARSATRPSFVAGRVLAPRDRRVSSISPPTNLRIGIPIYGFGMMLFLAFCSAPGWPVGAPKAKECHASTFKTLPSGCSSAG